MKEWFLNDTGEKFILFDISHFIALAVYLISVFLLIIFRNKIKLHKKAFQFIRWMLFILLIGSESVFQIWIFIHGPWQNHFPFHLCSIAGIIGAISLLTLHRRLIAISFFIGLIPALSALITPELFYGFPSIRFFVFFSQHIAISLTSLFLVICTQSKRITFKLMIETYILLLIYAALIGFLINPWLNTNFLFLSQPPATNSPLDYLGTGTSYYIGLVTLTFIVFLIQYVIYYSFKNKKLF